MPIAKKKIPAPPPSTMGALRDKLAKRYGDQVVRRESYIKYGVISTGSFSLDLALRTGGWVEGRIHELVGPEGVGKTTTAINHMIEAQKKYPEKAVGYIDMEQTFDYDWAESLGLDTSEDRFFHLFPDDSEDVSDMLRLQIETGFFSVVVVDSIGGMESKEAFEKEADEKVIGRNAQVITRMVKRCAVLARKHRTLVLLINQYRAPVGTMATRDVSAGPKAMRYATTTKTEMARASGDDNSIKYTLPGDKDPVEIGRKIRARVSRSKVSVQGKSGEFFIFNADTPEYGPVGVDKADEAVTAGVLFEVIKQGGAWYTVPGAAGKDHRFQGREKVLAHLRSCPEDLEHIRDRCLALLAGDVIEEVEVTLEHEGADA